MGMLDNLPPLPKEKSPVWKRSFLAYVLHGKSFVEHGKALQRPELRDHMLKLDIGANAGQVIELRVIDPEFFSEQGFTAIIKRDGKPIEAGKAAPHEDGKGYQLRLTHDATDGEIIALRSAGPIPTGNSRKRKPAARPKAEPKAAS
jgi:hypothetical protein